MFSGFSLFLFFIAICQQLCIAVRDSVLLELSFFQTRVSKNQPQKNSYNAAIVTMPLTINVETRGSKLVAI